VETEIFENAVAELQNIDLEQTTAYMCSEAVCGDVIVRWSPII
jgi:hypothetical protein